MLPSINVEERQHLKDFEDRVIDIIMVLDATIETITSLHEKYNQFRFYASRDLEDSSDENFDAIDLALQEKQHEVESNRRKVQNLRTKVQSTTELVSEWLSLTSSGKHLMMSHSFQVSWI